MYTDHETYCGDCGAVVTDRPIDHGPEWRSFENGERGQRRTGAPQTSSMHDGGLSTTIGRWRDGHGQTLDGKTQQRFVRLRTHHTRAQYESTADRNLAAGLSEIRRMIGALGLSNGTCERASALFRTARDAGLLVGRSIEAVASASVYATCRCDRIVRTIEQVVAVSRMSVSAVSNAYSVMNTELGLPTTTPHPVEYVALIASAFDLPRAVVSAAEALTRRAWDGGSRTVVTLVVSPHRVSVS